MKFVCSVCGESYDSRHLSDFTRGVAGVQQPAAALRKMTDRPGDVLCSWCGDAPDPDEHTYLPVAGTTRALETLGFDGWGRADEGMRVFVSLNY